MWVQNAIDPSELLMVPAKQLVKKSLEKLPMPAAASAGDHEERLLLQDKPIPTPSKHQAGLQGKQQTPQESVWLLLVFLRSDLFCHCLSDSETVSPMHLSQKTFHLFPTG